MGERRCDMTSFYDYSMDFSHETLPDNLKRYESIISKLERGMSVTLAPDISYSLPIELDKYYEKTTHGKVKTICTYNLHNATVRLIGLPPNKTAERDFDEAVGNWWKYALAIAFGALYVYLFFVGLIV
jgi:hypothetical protein